MQIVVASHNPVKINATRQAFAQLFPDAALEMIPVSVDSGAGDQPDSDARNLSIPAWNSAKPMIAFFRR